MDADSASGQPPEPAPAPAAPPQAPPSAATAPAPPVPPPPAPAPLGKTTLGIDANVEAGLGVLFLWIGGLIVYLIEKDNAFVRFYAMQSMALWVTYVAAVALAVVLGIMSHIAHLPLSPAMGSEAFGLVFFIFWLILVVNAFQGKVYELPIVGKWCRTQSGFTG